MARSLEDVNVLELCIEADENHARRLADKYRRLGDLDHAAILQRAADDMRHTRLDLKSGFASQIEVTVIGGEGIEQGVQL